MYSGIGWQTARGSGTNAIVQTNRITSTIDSHDEASIIILQNYPPDLVRNPRRRRHSHGVLQIASGSGTNGIVETNRIFVKPKTASENTRGISRKLVVLEYKLTEQGYTETEIAHKLDEARKTLEAAKQDKREHSFLDDKKGVKGAKNKKKELRKDEDDSSSDSERDEKQTKWVQKKLKKSKKHKKSSKYESEDTSDSSTESDSDDSATDSDCGGRGLSKNGPVKKSRWKYDSDSDSSSDKVDRYVKRRRYKTSRQHDSDDDSDRSDEMVRVQASLKEQKDAGKEDKSGDRLEKSTRYERDRNNSKKQIRATKRRRHDSEYDYDNEIKRIEERGKSHLKKKKDDLRRMKRRMKRGKSHLNTASRNDLSDSDDDSGKRRGKGIDLRGKRKLEDEDRYEVRESKSRKHYHHGRYRD